MLPVRPVIYPAVLAGLSNGQLPDSVLVAVDGGRLIAPAAAAWNVMVFVADGQGIHLAPSSYYDTYRPYEIQERIFRERYTTDWLPGQPSRVWNGERWWQRPGTATAAVPGTSNHGLGLAVDVADVEQGGRLDWLLDHAEELGWSWEVQNEPWHLRYVSGDAALGDDDLTPEQAQQLAEVHAAWTLFRADWTNGGATEGGVGYPNLPTLFGWTLDNAQAARTAAQQAAAGINPDALADQIVARLEHTPLPDAAAVKQAVKDALKEGVG